MHLRFLFVLFLVAIINYSAEAQSIIEGRVFDRAGGETIPGVHITYGTEKGVLSDTHGTFSIICDAGSYVLLFSYIGYQDYKEELSVSTNDTIRLDVFLRQDVTSINEIVISAGRKEQRIAELSVSMNVLKPYQIARFHIVNAEELLHKTSGIEIMDGQISIRGGSGYSYGAGSRVITLIDGLPALSTDAGNVKWGTLPIENISRIEIIKGASSVLYGSSALNGVINFITRDASLEPLTKISLSTGIYDNPSRSEWKWWDSPRVQQNLSFSHSKTYGNTELGIGFRAMHDNGYRKFNDDSNIRLSINLKQHGKKNKSLLYGLSLYGSYNSKNDFLLWENASDGALKQSISTQMEYRGASIAIDPFISFSGKSSGKHDIKGRVLTNLNRLPDNTNNNSDSYSAYLEYQYSYSLNSKISMVAGFLEQYSEIKSNFYGDHNGLNLAGYMQFDLSISERIKAVSGFRLEQFSLDGEADAPVPIIRAGLNYKAGPKTYLRTSYGQGYRYPSIAEKHAYTIVGAVKILPNEEIKPEKGWSAELGLKQIFGDNMLSGVIDFAAFYSENTDMIEYVFGWYPDPITDISDYGFRPVNIENSRVYGFETEISLNRSLGAFNTSLSMAYTYMHPVEFSSFTGKSTGEYLKFRRKHSANASLNTSVKKFEGGITLYYKSEILEIDDVFLNPLSRETIMPGFYTYWTEENNGYFTMDINTGYRLSESILISLAIKNLTNTEYMGRPGDIQPHRYYSAMLSYTF